MAGLKDYQISVYVANLGKYAEGALQGAWITLPMPAERLQDTLKTEVGLGGRYEEYAIHDYEGGEGLLATVANPVEYESLTDLNLMCRAFESREDDDPDVYEKVRMVRDDLDAAPRTPLQYANLALNSDEIPYHSYDAPLWPDSKEAKYAWTAVNQGWASDAVPSGDVVQSPSDLGGGVVLPVIAGRCQFRRGQRLGYAVSAAARVGGIPLPSRFLVPQPYERVIVAVAPVLVRGDHLPGDGPGLFRRCAARWTSPSAGPTHRKRLLRPQGSASRWMTAWKRHTAADAVRQRRTEPRSTRWT